MFTLVYFSPTGNTKYVTQKLSEQLNITAMYPLEYINPLTLTPSSHLVILFAIHAFNAPKTVIRFVKALPMNTFTKISIVAVGCSESSINSGASLEIKRILAKKHYSIIVDNVIAIPSNMLIAYSNAYVQSQLIVAHQAIRTIAYALIHDIPTNRKVSYSAFILSKIGKLETLGARIFGLELKAKKSCNQCEICVKSCPEKNIRLCDNNTIHFGFKCIMCLRCIYTCPQKAITPRFSKFIPIKGGYSLKRYTNE